jgi:hypothetical protein
LPPQRLERGYGGVLDRRPVSSATCVDPGRVVAVKGFVEREQINVAHSPDVQVARDGTVQPETHIPPQFGKPGIEPIADTLGRADTDPGVIGADLLHAAQRVTRVWLLARSALLIGFLRQHFGDADSIIPGQDPIERVAGSCAPGFKRVEAATDISCHEVLSISLSERA